MKIITNSHFIAYNAGCQSNSCSDPEDEKIQEKEKTR